MLRRFAASKVHGGAALLRNAPGTTSRICRICPISHSLASSKACDAIMALRIPPAARQLRELIHCAQMVQSHALSFFYLSAPDFLLGMDSDMATRNVLGVIASHPELARDGIELRKFGLQLIESLATERVHPSWIVPGGVASPLSSRRVIVSLPICLPPGPLPNEPFDSSRRP